MEGRQVKVKGGEKIFVMILGFHYKHFSSIHKVFKTICKKVNIAKIRNESPFDGQAPPFYFLFGFICESENDLAVGHEKGRGVEIILLSPGSASISALYSYPPSFLPSILDTAFHHLSCVKGDFAQTVLSPLPFFSLLTTLLQVSAHRITSSSGNPLLPPTVTSLLTY